MLGSLMAPSNSKKILILEDDDESRFLYEEILNGEGFTTLGARDGKDAFECLERAIDLPDIIVMDLTFPVMSAEEFVLLLKSNIRFKSIPFLVISGHVDTEERAQELKAHGYLRKPFDIDQLISSIKKVLSPIL